MEKNHLHPTSSAGNGPVSDSKRPLNIQKHETKSNEFSKNKKVSGMLIKFFINDSMTLKKLYWFWVCSLISQTKIILTKINDF